jgi:diguanylate cyclase (GGDEF)-like protein
VQVSISLCNQTLADGERVSIAVIHDVSALKTPLDRATAMAETDELTGLGNRLRLTRRAQALLAHGRPFALLCLSLSHVAPRTGRLGPGQGDEALRTVAERLQREVQDGDVVVRLEGDAFVMMIDGINDAVAVVDRAQALAAQLRLPLQLAGERLSLAAHIGAAMGPRHGITLEVLLDAAADAMQQARQTDVFCLLAELPR